MSPLTSNYTVPYRQLSGIQTIYLVNSDPTFVSQRSNLLHSTVGVQQIPIDAATPSNGSDTYTPGTYTKTLQFLSYDSDLYDYPNGNSYTLPTWGADATLTITIGAIPTTDVDQSITVSMSGITNTLGLTINFCVQLTSVGGIPCTDNGNPVFFLITIYNDPSKTYQITNSANTFYQFQQRLEQGSYMETEIYGENGSVSYNQKAEITLEGYDTDTKNLIALLNVDRYRAIVADEYGNYYLLGNQNYLTSTTSDGGLGKTTADGVKTTITFEGKEPLSCLLLDNSVVLGGYITP